MATTSAPPAARCLGLCKRFGEVRAVEQVDLTLRAGEIHALLGENGAGGMIAARGRGITRNCSAAPVS